MMAMQGRLRPRDVLPSGWEMDRSRRTGQAYYRNLQTGQTTWDTPAASEASAADGRDGGGKAGAAGASPRSPEERSVGPSEGSSECPAASLHSEQQQELARRDSNLSFEAEGMRLPCICQICECGKHRCVVHEKRPGYGDINSVYRADYPWHDVEPRKAARENKGFLSTAYDPDHFNTNYLTSYVGHNAKRELVRPKSAPLQRTPFNATSTYRSEHGPKAPQGRPRRREPAYRGPPVPFTHKSTNQVEFVPRDVERRRPIRPDHRQGAHMPFEGNSTYNEFYREPGDAVQRRVRKLQGYMPLPEDRDFISMKQASYQEPTLSVCPAQGLPRKAPSRHTGHTHYKKMCSPMARATYV